MKAQKDRREQFSTISQAVSRPSSSLFFYFFFFFFLTSSTLVCQANII